MLEICPLRCDSIASEHPVYFITIESQELRFTRIMYFRICLWFFLFIKKKNMYSTKKIQYWFWYGEKFR